MPRRTLLWLAVWSGLLLATGFLAFGPWQSGGSGFPYGMPMMDELADEACCGWGMEADTPLSPAQREALATLEAQWLQRQRQLDQEIAEARTALWERYRASPRDWGAIREADRRLRRLYEQRREAWLDLQQQRQAVITSPAASPR